MAVASEAVEHVAIKTNGVYLHTVQAGPEDGPLVLLLHGFPEFWYGWRKQIPALVQAGYRVWVPDQRGYNLSSHPRGIQAYRIPNLVEDIRGLIQQSGRESVFLVGHDWGAVVAWWCAITYPELIKKLVILNVPHPSVMSEMLRSNPEQRRRSWYIFFFQIPWLAETLIRLNNWWLGKRSLQGSSLPGTFSPDDLQLYAEAWQRSGSMHTMINWYRAIVQHPSKLPVRAKIEPPTLILWGKQDRFLCPENAERSLAYCQRGELRLFEDATHWVQHEKPEVINAELLRFFSA